MRVGVVKDKSYREQIEDRAKRSRTQISSTKGEARVKGETRAAPNEDGGESVT